MSMWDAVSAGIQIVQEKLDNALGDPTDVSYSVCVHFILVLKTGSNPKNSN